MGERLGIGINAYSNVLPVTYFFREQRLESKVSFVEAVPAELNRLLAEGSIDLGPVSAFTYAEHAGKYETLNGLSVSAKGPVGSIFLFSKRPLARLDGARIALTNTSATSINLLKIILEKFEGFQPTYEMMSPRISTMLEQADAALLIGDHAIHAKWNEPAPYIYDLGQLWYNHTGMWMTFALWCVRKNAIETKRSALQEVHAEFLRAKQQGTEQIGEIIDFVLRKHGGTERFWRQYFLGLGHDFGLEQKQGLEYYFQCAQELGLISHATEVEVWGQAPKVKLT
ncbi:hypothetical protein BEP19_01815 [Ammoniphilus oxalaticus]|uniref:Chorismate dehydratase n=1 Tax=Ammoniphilus oxalaticus TaxID=66863 RepID=A0A419SN86_9BACL|nr:menaquinone biosynthesis protein [Ammoniphilus oxalaticus]RKD25702.1 hypothetical protein BEP19_01815 [Ammoniphilus oxalaticus]